MRQFTVSPSAAGFQRLSGCSDFILALNEPAFEGLRRNVTKGDVPQQGAEEGNPTTDEHRDPRDDKTAYQAVSNEALDRDAAVHVDMLCSAGGQSRSDVGGRAAHLLDSTSA